jgi:DNA-binding response OmpR family regulator
MKSKKRILLAASQEDRASVLKFTLETNRFFVIVAATSQEAIANLPGRAFDLVLVDWPLDGCAAVLDAAYAEETRSLVLAAKEKKRPGCCADDVIIYPASPAYLIDRIKVMCARKRGPRPTKKPVVSLPALPHAYMERRA